MLFGEEAAGRLSFLFPGWVDVASAKKYFAGGKDSKVIKASSIISPGSVNPRKIDWERAKYFLANEHPYFTGDKKRAAHQYIRANIG